MSSFSQTKPRSLFVIFILCGISLSFFTACKDDELLHDPAITKFLTGTDWRYESSEVTGMGTTSNEMGSIFVSILYSESVLTFYEDGTSMRLFPAVNYPGEWSWNSDQTIILYSENGGTTIREWTIVELTSTSLKVTYPYETGIAHLNFIK